MKTTLFLVLLSSVALAQQVTKKEIPGISTFAQVEEEGAAVKAAGMNYVHLPFDPQNPDAHLIDNFITAVTAPANQPAYVHCAAGGRAASLWMVKRVLADGWDEQRALTEANALGLNDRFRPFALNYIHSHGK